MPDLALQLQQVTRRYRAGTTGCSAAVVALDRVSLTVARSECVAVCGAPGSGKSTLLLCAAGILVPDEGVVRVVNATYVAPDVEQHPYLGVRASLEFAVSLRDLDGRDSADVDAVLAATETRELAGTRIGQLTPGMRARVSIAHALLAAPSLLCLDNPMVALDPAERRRYGRLLDALRRNGTAIVVSGRDAALLEPVASRVLRMHDGRLAAAMPERRTLELDVGMPTHAESVLGSCLPSVVRRGHALRVSLERISAEEVLSACLSLGIDVHGSRVITSPAVGRVAEGEE